MCVQRGGNLNLSFLVGEKLSYVVIFFERLTQQNICSHNVNGSEHYFNVTTLPFELCLQ